VEQLLAFGHVDGDHLARAQRALFDDGRLVGRHHPGLGSRDQQPVAGHDIAHRAQPVAVEPAQTQRPSVIASAAGPSHGSITELQ
jgi:hypothetical protein